MTACLQLYMFPIFLWKHFQESLLGGTSVLPSCIRLLEMQGVHERLGMPKAYGKIVKYLNSDQ